MYGTWVPVTARITASPVKTHLPLSVSSTTISSSVYVVISGVCLRFKPHGMFQISKYVIKGREELTSCSSLIHSHMFPLIWTVTCTEIRNHIVAAIQGAGNTISSA